MPSELEAERLRMPVGFLEAVIEARAYGVAHATYKAHPGTKDRSELVQLAKLISFELAKAEIDAKKKSKKKPR